MSAFYQSKALRVCRLTSVGCLALVFIQALAVGPAMAATARAWHGMAVAVPAGAEPTLDLVAYTFVGGVLNAASDDITTIPPAPPVVVAPAGAVPGGIVFPGFWGAVYMPGVGFRGLAKPAPPAAGLPPTSRIVTSTTTVGAVPAVRFAHAKAQYLVTAKGVATLFATATRDAIGKIRRDAVAEAVDPFSLAPGIYEYPVLIGDIELASECFDSSVGLRFFANSSEFSEPLWELCLRVDGIAETADALDITFSYQPGVFFDPFAPGQPYDFSSIESNLRNAITFNSALNEFYLNGDYMLFDADYENIQTIQYGQGLAASAVPEPTSLLLLAFAALVLVRRRSLR